MLSGYFQDQSAGGREPSRSSRYRTLPIETEPFMMAARCRWVPTTPGPLESYIYSKKYPSDSQRRECDRDFAKGTHGLSNTLSRQLSAAGTSAFDQRSMGQAGDIRHISRFVEGGASSLLSIFSLLQSLIVVSSGLWFRCSRKKRSNMMFPLPCFRPRFDSRRRNLRFKSTAMCGHAGLRRRLNRGLANCFVKGGVVICLKIFFTFSESTQSFIR